MANIGIFKIFGFGIGGLIGFPDKSSLGKGSHDMKRKYLIIGLGFFLLFESDLLAQQHSTNTKRGTAPRLSGRAVRSSHTPGLSSVRRTRLNIQVINGVLKQNTPTKAGQRQISSIQRRLLLRLPPLIVIGEGTGNNSGWVRCMRINSYNCDGVKIVYYISHPGATWWSRIYYRPPQ